MSFKIRGVNGSGKFFRFRYTKLTALRRRPKAFFLVLFLLIKIVNVYSVLLPAYYLNSKGDTVHGKMDIHFTPGVPDSIFYYELQYNVLFANKEGKVLLLRPSKLIREIGIFHQNAWRKMICVKRKETVGSRKVRHTEYIFLLRVLHGPIEVYSIILKRMGGLFDYETDLCFHRKGTNIKVRESGFRSEMQFAELVSDCPEALDWLKRNGILTESQMFDLVYQYNKYCAK